MIKREREKPQSATRRIDKKTDILSVVESIQEEQLTDDSVGDEVIDVGSQEHDPLLQQQPHRVCFSSRGHCLLRLIILDNSNWAWTAASRGRRRHGRRRRVDFGRGFCFCGGLEPWGRRDFGFGDEEGMRWTQRWWRWEQFHGVVTCYCSGVRKRFGGWAKERGS